MQATLKWCMTQTAQQVTGSPEKYRYSVSVRSQTGKRKKIEVLF